MKAKPDISGYVRPPKDPTDFLEGGAGDRGPREKVSHTVRQAPAPAGPKKPEPTVQKLFRLRWDVANALKMGAAEASVSAGKRVTETEIIEQLIREQFELDR